MRWKKNNPEYPPFGTIRTVRRFLWMPKNIRDDVRWLCFAEYTQEYCQRARPVHPSTPPGIAKAIGYMVSGWVDHAWADGEIPSETRTERYAKLPPEIRRRMNIVETSHASK